MEGFFGLLTFFGTGFGLAATGAVAAAIILIWEWRSALLGLFVVQLAVASVAVRVEQVPAEWAGVMTAVMALACLILALSARQARGVQSPARSGTWMLRGLAIAFIFFGWRALSNIVTIPQLVPEVTSLFVWLGMTTLILMGLSDDPLFTGVAMLLWCVPAQAVVWVLLGIPALIALIGIAELAVALACSYLVLSAQQPAENKQAVLTDIAFPTQADADDGRVAPAGAAQGANGMPAPGSAVLGEWVRRWWPRSPAQPRAAQPPGEGALAARKRQ